MSGWVQRAPSGRHKAMYRFKDGRKRAKTFDTEQQAKDWLAEIRTDLKRGEYVDDRAGDVTLAAVADDFFKLRIGLRSTTRVRDDSVYRTHILPVFGKMSIGEIKQPHIKAWLVAMEGKGYSAYTISRAYQLVSRMLEDAVEGELLKRSPCRGIKLPRHEDIEMHFLDVPQVWALADAIAPRFRALILLGCYGGLRIGEMCALQQKHILAMKNEIEVRGTLVEVRGTLEFHTPKTKAGRRNVPIPRSIARELGEHITRFCAPGPDAFVFTGAQGGNLRPRQWRARHFIPACVSTGVGTVTKVNKRDHYEGLRPHDMRHTAVAIWIAAGWSPFEIAKRAGHRSTVTVMDRYGHLLPSGEESAMERLERLATPMPRPASADVRALHRG